MWFILVGVDAAQAQIVVSQAEVQKHLLKRIEPAFPPKARTGRGRGIVVVKIRIAKDGSVAETELLTGHPLLGWVAEQAIRQWMYTPFTSNGAPVEATSTVEVSSWPPGEGGRDKDEQQTNAGYFEMEEECRDLHAAQQSRQAEEVCRAAVDLVERFPPDRVHTRVGAYENLGYVLLDQRKFPESIDYFKRAALHHQAMRYRHWNPSLFDEIQDSATRCKRIGDRFFN